MLGGGYFFRHYLFICVIIGICAMRKNNIKEMKQMAVQHRTRKSTKAKSPSKPLPTKICKVCDKSKKINEFYKVDSKLHPDGRMDVCTDCLKEGMDPSNMDEVVGILRQMNKPFIKDVWENAVESSSKLKSKPHPFGEYMRNINSLKQYSDKTFKDSEEVFTVSDMYDKNLSSITRDDGEEIKFDPEMIIKWGERYTQYELLKLEKFYQEMSLQYDVSTEIQKNLLRQLAVVSLEMDKALSDGEHKIYNDLVRSQNTIMQSSGFRPIDKKNINDETGLGSFSEIWAEIEKEDGFIPEGLVDYPKDDIDAMLLYYVQGIQRFSGTSVSTEIDPDWRDVAEEMIDALEAGEDEDES